MDKAYNPTDWQNRPSTASPLDEMNLDALSQGLSLVDNRVISLYNAVEDSVGSISVDETTGRITITKVSGSTYAYNPVSRVYDTISAVQSSNNQRFSNISNSLESVDDMLAEMDSKIDFNAETANTGIKTLFHLQESFS